MRKNEVLYINEENCEEKPNQQKAATITREDQTVAFKAYVVTAK